jgi:hypothetical protein
MDFNRGRADGQPFHRFLTSTSQDAAAGAMHGLGVLCPPAQGLGRQADLGRGASAIGPDVGVADVLAAGALGAGLPQPTPSWHAGGTGFVPRTGGREATHSNDASLPSRRRYDRVIVRPSANLAAEVKRG